MYCHHHLLCCPRSQANLTPALRNFGFGGGWLQLQLMQRHVDIGYKLSSAALDRASSGAGHKPQPRCFIACSLPAHGGPRATPPDAANKATPLPSSRNPLDGGSIEVLLALEQALLSRRQQHSHLTVSHAVADVGRLQH